MKGRMTLHNLGSGVLDAKFDSVRDELFKALSELKSKVDSDTSEIIDASLSAIFDARDEQIAKLLKENKRVLNVITNAMLEVMRQNVYIIELMRDLLDKEPRYDPRRWYDHGWM